MNKAEALKKAEAARHAAKVALARHAMLASVFGGNDKLAQHAMLEHDVAIEAHYKWMWVAKLHPASRNKLIRTQALPSFIFGY